MTRFWQYT